MVSNMLLQLPRRLLCALHPRLRDVEDVSIFRSDALAVVLLMRRPRISQWRHLAALGPFWKLGSARILNRVLRRREPAGISFVNVAKDPRGRAASQSPTQHVWSVELKALASFLTEPKASGYSAFKDSVSKNYIWSGVWDQSP